MLFGSANSKIDRFFKNFYTGSDWMEFTSNINDIDLCLYKVGKYTEVLIDCTFQHTAGSHGLFLSYRWRIKYNDIDLG